MAALKGYSFTQIRLHWVVAVLILFQLMFGGEMGTAWRAVSQGTEPVMSSMVWAHILIGIAVLALVAWRIALRFRRGVPPVPHSDSVLMVKAAEWGHLAIYAVMIFAPVSGLMAWFGGIDTAAVGTPWHPHRD